MGIDLGRFITKEDFTRKNERGILPFFDKLDTKFGLETYGGAGAGGGSDTAASS